MGAKSVKIDGVSYNADHAKAIGKEAFTNAKEIQHHHQHLTEPDRKKALGDIFDKIVAAPDAAAPMAK